MARNEIVFEPGQCRSPGECLAGRFKLSEQFKHAQALVPGRGRGCVIPILLLLPISNSSPKAGAGTSTVEQPTRASICLYQRHTVFACSVSFWTFPHTRARSFCSAPFMTYRKEQSFRWGRRRASGILNLLAFLPQPSARETVDLQSTSSNR